MAKTFYESLTWKVDTQVVLPTQVAYVVFDVGLMKYVSPDGSTSWKVDEVEWFQYQDEAEEAIGTLVTLYNFASCNLKILKLEVNTTDVSK